MTSVDDAIREALDAPFEGWDLSWLDGRVEETKPPWDYPSLVRGAMTDAGRTLDIDTGGGEFLAGLAPLRGFVVATEGYPPNVRVANEHLGPARVLLVQAASAPDNVDQGAAEPIVDGSPLPLADASFGLVIDRHSSYWPSEVRRVLRTGGRFLTQQRSETGERGASWADLFDRPGEGTVRFDASFAARQLREAGFEIVRSEEADTPVRFNDLPGVVYYLRAVPWAVPGFDVIRDRGALERIDDALREGPVVIRGSHMLIDAIAVER